jgi:GntR family transcriptional regulator
MNFHNQTAIYLQIAEYIGEQVLSQKLAPDDKVPSIRELAVQLEVNPNTVQRTYDFLQTQEVIFTKRGLGYFVAPNAYDHYLNWRRSQFMTNELPLFFKQISLLQLDFDQLKAQYETFINPINA